MKKKGALAFAKLDVGFIKAVDFWGTTTQHFQLTREEPSLL